ncbi:TPA: hypothetical protein ACH3X2_002431 [Trebouxia sp. C0005]
MGDATVEGVAGEIYAKHRNSTQPESHQVCAILGAVLEVVQAEGLQPTPTTLFAALMSSLEKSETQASAQVAGAMCTVLASVLGRVPAQILRSRFNASVQIMQSIVGQNDQQAGTLRAALACLSYITAAVNPTEWAPALRPFTLLLRYSTDARPKVRKRAQYSLVDVLAALQGTPALQGASDAVLKVCEIILPGPEAAARAAAAASNKKRNEAEAAIADAVSRALHMLGSLKQIVALLAGNVVGPLSKMLLKLYVLRQPMLSRSTTDCLEMLCSAKNSHLGSAALGEVLQQVLQQEAAWDRKDTDLMLALTSFIETGFTRLHELDASVCALRLPQAFHLLLPQLCAEQEGVRFGTQQALKNLIHDCVDESMVNTAVSRGSMSSSAMPPAQSIVVAVANTLTVRYQDGWINALSVAGELLERLGSEGAPLAEGLLLRLGEMCAGASDAAEEEGTDEGSNKVALAAQNALGQAIRAMGPQAVLQVLPLGLVEALEGDGEARTWLIPLLRQHVQGAHLAYWGSELLPLARALGSRAALAQQSPGRQLEAQQCRALELQLWNTLQSFCSWALDTATAFRSYAKGIGTAFEKRQDLRVIICNALATLCLQNRKALKAAGVTEGVGYSDPSGIQQTNADNEEEQSDVVLPGEVPTHYDLHTAQANTQVLKDFAKNWLPLLFNAFIATDSQERNSYGSAIAAYATIADAATLSHFFREVIKRLLKVGEDEAAGVPATGVAREGGDSPTARKCTYMELALCLAPGLDVNGVSILYKAAKPSLQERDQAAQKKAYKLVAYICEHRPDFLRAHCQDMTDCLLAGVVTSMSAAKRYRLRCLKALILLLQSNDAPEIHMAQALQDAGQTETRQQVVGSMVSEIILCVKEVNQKTRTAAYELLVSLAKAMHEQHPPPLPALGQDMDMEASDSMHSRGGLHTLFSMVLGGLVAATPHMIAATVMALARLLYEFAGPLEYMVDDLLPAVLALLRTKSREVVKAVLGFVKVVAMRLPIPVVTAHVKAILEGILLWSADTKNQFKLKVRVVVERLARRLGYDAVAENIPEEHRKLLTHIRKEKTRKLREDKAEKMEMDGGEAKSKFGGSTKRARTLGGSEWDSQVFSDDEAEADVRTKLGAATLSGATRPARSAGKSAKSIARGGKGLPREIEGNPLDLLDAGTSRKMVKHAAARGAPAAPAEEEDDFEHEADGKIIVKDEEAQGKKRRRKSHLDDSDDSDFDDIRHVHGAKAALREGAGSVRYAATAGAKSRGRSTAGGSVGGRSIGARTSATAKGAGSQHSGDRFKARKGAKGDTKGASKVEPYAYWPLDRKMLNRRAGKQAAAKKGLERVVKAAKTGAVKGHKAKRRRT